MNGDRVVEPSGGRISTNASTAKPQLQEGDHLTVRQVELD
jgi:hypothetical protein